jgi:trans-2,3-dihydro-3-hydroxyanthranilate isomerase
VLRSLEALQKLKVDHDAATPWLRERGARWFYVLAPAAAHHSPEQAVSGCDYRARMQFAGSEDPATGSAAGCAISCLVGRGAVGSGRRIHVRQGVEIGRASDLFLTARRDGTRVTDVRVAGSTMPVAHGSIRVP